jgi:energy-coupling factor transporter ATP-binding protein EcfA2
MCSARSRVKENLEMGGYLLPRRQVASRIERVVTVFPRLGTMLGRIAAKLSGGERKMLAMGRVLMLNPGVFLLDKPTANLAPVIATALLEQHVHQLATGGAAVLIVEQRARAALAISDRAYVLGGARCGCRARPPNCQRARNSRNPSSAATPAKSPAAMVEPRMPTGPVHDRPVITCRGRPTTPHDHAIAISSPRACQRSRSVAAAWVDPG